MEFLANLLVKLEKIYQKIFFNLKYYSISFTGTATSFPVVVDVSFVMDRAQERKPKRKSNNGDNGECSLVQSGIRHWTKRR